MHSSSLKKHRKTIKVIFGTKKAYSRILSTRHISSINRSQSTLIENPSGTQSPSFFMQKVSGKESSEYDTREMKQGKCEVVSIKSEEDCANFENSFIQE